MGELGDAIRDAVGHLGHTPGGGCCEGVDMEALAAQAEALAVERDEWRHKAIRRNLALARAEGERDEALDHVRELTDEVAAAWAKVRSLSGSGPAADPFSKTLSVEEVRDHWKRRAERAEAEANEATSALEGVREVADAYLRRAKRAEAVAERVRALADEADAKANAATVPLPSPFFGLVSTDRLRAALDGPQEASGGRETGEGRGSGTPEGGGGLDAGEGRGALLDANRRAFEYEMTEGAAQIRQAGRTAREFALAARTLAATASASECGDRLGDTRCTLPAGPHEWHERTEGDVTTAWRRA